MPIGDSSESNRRRFCYRAGLGDHGDDVMPPFLYQFGRPGSDLGMVQISDLCERSENENLR